MFAFDTVAVLDIDLVCMEVIVHVGLADIVFDTEADAVIVKVMRPEKDTNGLLLCVTEAVVVLDTKDELETVVDRVAVFVGF